ncbi:hypothetical protein VMCG_08692 [Cytospora schulzeri]|uniref:Major facilitator superfamily (MFS) profile domain-containing protein n=1 Tax=Cytospora schulzeri TaxID=448051 RepID=A0A423VQB9_9PEZI|nr:hypothetical protein VMCG_08692 [Valsa malicola]
MKPKVYQFFLALFAAFGSFLYGYDLGVIASVVASDSFVDKFLSVDSSTRSGTVVALFTAGAFFGAFAAGFTDPLGRRGTLVLGAVLFVIGGVLQTAAEVIAMLLGLQILPALGLAICAMLLPESPRWLVDHDQSEKALQTLAKLHANGNVEDPYVQAEFEIITAQILDEHENAAKSFKELFKDRANSRRIITACVCQASAQMTGVSAFQYFSPTIFDQMGISAGRTLLYQGFNSIIGELAQFIFFFLIDRVGRRPLQIWGNLACCAALVIGAALLAEFPPSTTDNLGAQWAFIVASTWVFNFCFCASGTMSWIIPAEIFNTATRTRGVSIATMVSFAFNTLIGQVTPIAMAKVGWKFYLLFIVCDITNALWFYLFLPETKGLKLEAMDDLFANSPWVVVGSKWKPGIEADVNRLAEKKTHLAEYHYDRTEVASKAAEPT